MKYNLLRRKSSFLLIAAVLIFGFIASSTPASSQPQIPVLSLSGAGQGWDDTWYPDGRIRVPASPAGQPREFLVPVFIYNGWETDPAHPGYVANPIYSFKFSIQYDTSAVRPVGVQKFGPRDEELGYEPLAKHFAIDWDDYRDTTYWTYLNPLKNEDDKGRGHSLTITGSSMSQPLPSEDPGSTDYKVLLYVKFRVIPRTDQFTGTGGMTPLIIATDSIEYNGVNIRAENPFEHGMGHFSNETLLDLYNPRPETGLGGINNTGTQVFPTEPTLPGSIFLNIYEDLPEFEFDMTRGIGSPPFIEEITPFLHNVKQPITTIRSNNPVPAERDLLVYNSVGQTRMQNITIKSDQKWLTYTIEKGNRTINPDANGEVWINWLDNGLLGEDALDVMGDPTTDDGDLHMTIQCIPDRLVGSADYLHGVYVGYLTFSSTYARFSPVRVRVTFIYFDVPREPDLYDEEGEYGGIKLNITNSRSNADGGYQETSMIFGVGPKAGDGVDSVYGEFAYNSDLDPESFGARFYVPENMPDELKDEIPFGFGDFAPTDENQMTGIENPPGSGNIIQGTGSRDIRNVEDTLTSLTYLVRFNAGSRNNYPITITWNVNDFPEGASLFLRDTINGNNFSVNMREATPQGNGFYSYTVQDPRWSSFIIEYTLPRVIYYVDEYGNPLIKKGWNLLSLPVRPISTQWDDVYPNALNKPIDFYNSGYQEVENLKVGKGYYVKYSDIVDLQFAGAFIDRISPNQGDMVRLYPGWNTIGALSSNVGISQINFFEVPGQNLPEKELVMRHGIWGYKTARGFYEVTALKPGLGYWLNCVREDREPAHAYYEIELPPLPRMAVPYDNSAKQMVLNNADELMLRDNGQSETSLYMTGDAEANVDYFQLPPLPPAGYFDARFSNGAILENSENTVLNLQGVQYPISLSIDNPTANYTFVDAITGEELGRIEYGSTNNVEIEETAGDAIKILKSERAVPAFFISAYPNPVAGNTTFEYAVPQNGFVNVSLFDAIGNHVSTIVSEDQDAGTYHIDFDASELSSGTYIIKLTSGENSTVRTITVVK